jgi:hypothetical protein
MSGRARFHQSGSSRRGIANCPSTCHCSLCGFLTRAASVYAMIALLSDRPT